MHLLSDSPLRFLLAPHLDQLRSPECKHHTLRTSARIRILLLLDGKFLSGCHDWANPDTLSGLANAPNDAAAIRRDSGIRHGAAQSLSITISSPPTKKVDEPDLAPAHTAADFARTNQLT